MPTCVRMSFRHDVSLTEVSDDEIAVRSPAGVTVVKTPSPGLALAVQTLALGSATEDELCGIVVDADDTAALSRLYYYLERFASQSLLSFTLDISGRPFLTVQPMTGTFRLGRDPVAEDVRFRLSRFAYCRIDGGDFVLESPLSTARTVVHDPLALALLHGLSQSRSSVDLCAVVDGVDRETTREFVYLLSAAALITPATEGDTRAEDADAALAQWEFHDLLFHSRSRSGRHDYPVGGTYPFLGEIAALPALKPRMSGESLPLHVPDLGQLARCDAPFTRVLEGRRSVRVHGGDPVTVDELGEFLYRAARVDKVVEEDPASSRHCETSVRPYPSGGASYDLEVYVSVHRCAGLARGVYHYEPLDHRLRRLSGGDDHLETLLRQAQRAAVLPRRPQLLITITSRFQRVSWKYRGLAYALTLKNVGVLLQTMYLVATAMDLAPCALGTGDASLFAAVLGEEYVRESSVGEFVLGSLPVGGGARRQRSASAARRWPEAPRWGTVGDTP